MKTSITLVSLTAAAMAVVAFAPSPPPAPAPVITAERPDPLAGMRAKAERDAEIRRMALRYERIKAQLNAEAMR